MGNLLEYLKANNLLAKLLSIVMATALWFFVQDKNTRASTLILPLEPIELPKDFALARPVDWENQTVKITFSGSRESLEFNKEGYNILVEPPARLKEGINIFKLNLNRKVPDQVYYRISPRTLKLELTRAGEKRLPVRIPPDYTHSGNFVLKDIRLRPKTVLVRGPKKEIGNLKQINTRPFDIPATVGPVELPVRLSLPGNNFQILSKQDNFSLRGNIMDKRNFRVARFKSVEIEPAGLNPALGVKIIPGALDLAFLVPREENLDRENVQVLVDASLVYLKGNKILPETIFRDVPVEIRFPGIPENLRKNIVVLEKRPGEIRLIFRLKNPPAGETP